jgi:antitoxin PrlF
MGRILGMAKVSTKFQITIPADARKEFELKIGDKMLFIEEGGKLILQKAE